MARSDPDKLAAALRENLRKRKAQSRAHVAEPSHRTDEEGDDVMPADGSAHPEASVIKA